VYSGSYLDFLFALDFASGGEVWRCPTRKDRGGSGVRPKYFRGIVYFSSSDHYLYAIEGSTGRVLWRHDAGDFIEHSPAVSDEVVCIGSNAFAIQCVERATGTLRWSVITGAHAESPLIIGETLYCTSADRSLYAIKLKSGEVRWRFRSPTSYSSDIVAYDRFIYVATWDGKSIVPLPNKRRFPTEHAALGQARCLFQYVSPTEASWRS
jgi:outer membrane protein assembly factor BamB